MFIASFLQRNSGWSFDIRSALIGAILAWIIAGILYKQRVAIKQRSAAIQGWVARIRRQLRASNEERYLKTLQEALRGLLLFTPQNPQTVFVPPHFLSPAAMPQTPEASGKLPEPVEIVYSRLLDGHSRLILTGPLTSGRTTALALLVWEIAKTGEEADPAPFSRFPLWVDMEDFTRPEEGEEVTDDALKQLAELAVKFMPQATSKFILSNLNNGPALVLVDNWETIPAENRKVTANWIAEAAEQLPESIWVIASGPSGYGPLVEADFVPLKIIPPLGESLLPTLYTGWAELLGKEDNSIPDELLPPLQWAALSGASPAELTLRVMLALQTGKAPDRASDVLQTWLQGLVPTPKLGKEDQETEQDIQNYILNTLCYIARSQDLDKKLLSKDEISQFILTQFPPEDERASKLENIVRKAIQKSKIMDKTGEEWKINHYVWSNYLTAIALTQETDASPLLEIHLYEGSWQFILECFVGLSDATPLVYALLKNIYTIQPPRTIKADESALKSLLRLARWAILAPAGAEWRKHVMKALAQGFTIVEISNPQRQKLGRALALIAGEGARAFFIKALRHPDTNVRAVALRGLGWVGTPREIDVLAAALRDRDVAIRRNAVLALADQGTPGALRILMQTLEYGDEQLVLTIGEVFAATPAGWDILKESASSPDILVRRAVAHGLGFIRQTWATEILNHMVIEDPEWLVRSSAEAALKEQETHREMTAVVNSPPQVEQLEWLMQWASKQGLGLGVGDAAIEALNQAIRSPEPETRILAAHTLAHIGRWDHLTPLRAMLMDEYPAVRTAAQEAIDLIEQRYELDNE